MNFKIIDIYKKHPVYLLSILLFLSIISALYMPAMLTFYLGLPLLILFVLKQRLSLSVFLTTIIVIGISVVLLVGFFIYLELFILFIHSFPTYVVLLTTLLLMHLIPLKMHLIFKVITFILLSALIGLNTKIIDIMKHKYIIEEKINGTLMLNDNDIVRIEGNTLEIPSFYNSYDFITFGANEAHGGFWIYPKLESINIAELLQKREVSYTQKNNSPYILSINSSGNIKDHIIEIKVKSDSKLVSSLKIVDQLPYQSI